MWQLREGHMSPFRLAAEGRTGNKYGHSLRAKQFPSLVGQWPCAQEELRQARLGRLLVTLITMAVRSLRLAPRGWLYRAVGHQLSTEEEAAWPGAPRPSGW